LGIPLPREREFEEVIMVEVEVRIEEMFGSARRRSKNYERAMVVEAKVKEEPRRPLFGVNGEVRSKRI